MDGSDAGAGRDPAPICPNCTPQYTMGTSTPVGYFCHGWRDERCQDPSKLAKIAAGDPNPTPGPFVDAGAPATYGPASADAATPAAARPLGAALLMVSYPLLKRALGLPPELEISSIHWNGDHHAVDLVLVGPGLPVVEAGGALPRLKGAIAEVDGKRLEVVRLDVDLVARR